MVFTTNKPLSEWGRVLHDEDLAVAILDRILERGRFIHLGGPSGRTRHLNLEEVLPEKAERLRISGINGSEFPEPTLISLHGETSTLATSIGRDRKGKISIAIYAAAIPLAFAKPWVAGSCYVIVAVMWLIPDPRIERRIERRQT